MASLTRERLSEAASKSFIQKHSVDEELEDQWMILYTKVYTRELVFAVDVTNFVMKENHLHFQNFIFPNCLGVRCASDFGLMIETFVAMTLQKHATVIQEMLERNVDLMLKPSYADFKAYVNSLAVSTESSVYFEEYGFLVFSVVIAHMCSLAFLYGMSKAPEFGIMTLCRLHSHFRMRGLLAQDTWAKLQEAAQHGILMQKLDSLNVANNC
ncbi:hypothetical protein JTE90_025418 [Oedothorax gibbosus]|uniref:Uncharacterized protein n=1 Tax=Oedothorax gibbosus TaxID=931172 RepID=A0AAV6TL19_9ARAC|nr:hypothetical protein JTE90_025418 [Oedothorax gibbosus]